MDVWGQVKVSAVQKAMQLSWLIALLAIVTFVDCYLILKYDRGISILTLEWVKRVVDLKDLIIGVGLFSFVFAAVLPGFWLFIWPFLQIAISRVTNNDSNFYKSPGKDFTRIETLMARAAKDGNSALLRYCELQKQEIDTRDFISTCAQGVLVLTFISWIFAPSGVLPVAFEIHGYAEQFPWYISRPVNAVIVLFYMAVLVMSGLRKSGSDNYIGISIGPESKDSKSA